METGTEADAVQRPCTEVCRSFRPPCSELVESHIPTSLIPPQLPSCPDRLSNSHSTHTPHNTRRSLPSHPMDSTAVDFRAFYPYTPNEVKHRKRTTNAQLKTLETVFNRDTKPNGPLRVELAAQLGMTARGVQVSRLWSPKFFMPLRLYP